MDSMANRVVPSDHTLLLEESADHDAKDDCVKNESASAIEDSQGKTTHFVEARTQKMRKLLKSAAMR